MRLLVYIDDLRGVPTRDSLGALSHAASLGADVSAVAFGVDAVRLASEAGQFGAARLIAATDPTVEAPLSQPRVDVLANLVAGSDFDLVLFPSSTLAADVAAGLAARLDAGINWDLLALSIDSGDPVGTRLALRDSVVVAVGWKARPGIGLFRAGALEPVPTGGVAEVEEMSVAAQESSLRVALLEQIPTPNEGTALEAADIIVAGGRGVGSPEGFAVLEELATKLGGAVAATMPAVDRSWYPASAQVGQTGETVAPRLYLACGISGAVQHRVGMQNSGLVVAVNTDPSAPIFDHCDLGVVGDLHEVVPRLTSLLGKLTRSEAGR